MKQREFATLKSLPKIVISALALFASASSFAGSITGVVAYSDGAPVVSASVYLYGADGAYLADIAVDPDGAYAFSVLEPGEYYARTSNSDGYVNETHAGDWCSRWCYLNSFAGAELATITVADNETVVDFELDKGAQITGVVTDSDGAPIEDVYIDVFNQGKRIERIYVAVGDLGEYVSQALPDGDYSVQTVSKAGYIKECYGASSVCRLGSDLKIKNRQTVVNINFVLRNSGVIKVNLKTANEADAGLVRLYVYRENSNSTFLASPYVPVSGTELTTFVFDRDLEPGQYYVHTLNFDGFIDQLNDGTPCLALCYPKRGNALDVVIGVDAEVNTVLEKGGKISGMVTEESGEWTAPGQLVWILDQDDNLVSYGLTDIFGFGFYTSIGGLPDGNYHVRTINGYGYIDEYHDGSAVAGQAVAPLLAVVAGDEHNIDFALSKGAAITGLVKDAETGAVIEGAPINVFDSQGKWITSGQSKAAGLKLNGSLPIGNYYVVVTKPGYVGKLYGDVTFDTTTYCSGTFMCQLDVALAVQEGAETISVDSAEAVNIEVLLVPVVEAVSPTDEVTPEVPGPKMPSKLEQDVNVVTDSAPAGGGGAIAYWFLLVVACLRVRGMRRRIYTTAK